MAVAEATAEQKSSIFDSQFPVFLPSNNALHLEEGEFQAWLNTLFTPSKSEAVVVREENAPTSSATPAQTVEDNEKPKSAFMDALLVDSHRHATKQELEADNKMLTENADVAHKSSKSALVDAFYELEESCSASRLQELLGSAWNEDASATLRIIFNARSIHLGKSSRFVSYRAFGWLAENHPLTLLANLRWLTRPVIQKKVTKEDDKKPTADNADKMDEDDDEFMMVDPEETKEESSEKAPKMAHDVKHGVSHGYWKDLLNLLALAANDQLQAAGDPKSLLQSQDNSPAAKRKREYDPEKAKIKRTQAEADRYQTVVRKLEKDPFYRALHFSVARLFATQLQEDVKLLTSGDKGALKHLSLAAKWAPTFKGFHDKHTIIVSTIAELLYPDASKIYPELDAAKDRDLYIRHAREAYRRLTVSPLRKALAVVERDITAQTFANIKYERLPSLAMNRYMGLFAKKDFDHFDEYVETLAEGKTRISGATLLPSTLVAKMPNPNRYTFPVRKKSPNDALVEQKMAEMEQKLIDGQWKTLVQRMKGSGKIESSLAVCDVSGSMTYPEFPDGTCPIDSAIGLSLLFAEITEAPFGGALITFSETPAIVRVGGVDDKRSFSEKVEAIRNSNWAMNTDFVAVFEKLILPMAIANKLKPEEMVKQVFVFSDMQFDQANSGSERWTTSYERIKKHYAEAGYDMPKLIFWNLAGGRAGYNDISLSVNDTDDTAPKPVTIEGVGTALVSGYSQGQMKMFLDGGQFEDPEEEVVVEVKAEAMDEDGDDETLIEVKKKEKMDPISVVKKAISHKAYSMLEVVD